MLPNASSNGSPASCLIPREIRSLSEHRFRRVYTMVVVGDKHPWCNEAALANADTAGNFDLGALADEGVCADVQLGGRTAQNTEKLQKDNV